MIRPKISSVKTVAKNITRQARELELICSTAPVIQEKQSRYLADKMFVTSYIGILQSSIDEMKILINYKAE